jgi:hypothetical protein
LPASQPLQIFDQEGERRLAGFPTIGIDVLDGGESHAQSRYAQQAIHLEREVLEDEVITKSKVFAALGSQVNDLLALEGAVADLLGQEFQSQRRKAADFEA